MSCIFCEIANGRIPANVVWEDEDVIAILDVNPVSVGHTLVMPKSHVEDITVCDGKTVGKVFGTAAALAARLKKTLGADGINVVTNAGEAAGQTVPHLHVHLIPRYENGEKEDFAIRFGKVNADPEKVLETVKGR